MQSAKINNKWHLVVPKRVLKNMGVKPGDWISFEVNGQKVTMLADHTDHGTIDPHKEGGEVVSIDGD